MAVLLRSVRTSHARSAMGYRALIVVFGAISLLVPAADSSEFVAPLTSTSMCLPTQTCRQLINGFADASWQALVDDQFNTGPLPLAAVRHYTTEGNCTGALCSGQLETGSQPVDPSASCFYGVTDELSNVMLATAVADDEGRFRKLRNFAELLRAPQRNGLQCWKYYIGGRRQYSGAADVCILDDSASDASLRILGAYGIGCAKERAGIWPRGGGYCADYERQANAVISAVSAAHGELKQLPDGTFFLSNGFNNYGGSPTAPQSFRPDYYELQFLGDYADYSGSPALQRAVGDLVQVYLRATGTNRIHRGQNGHFDAQALTYTCDALCTPEYMDENDTWRAVPAMSGVRLVHPELVPPMTMAPLFDTWWSHYSGGNGTYMVTAPKPIEIYSNAADGGVKRADDGYKTIGMWLPLAVAYDSTYATDLVRYIDQKYDAAGRHFYGAAYFGGYFSQFVVRGVALAAGMLDSAGWYSTAADFNRDGRADLFWRHRTNGFNYLWFLHDRSVRQALPVATVADTNWSALSAGNCFGDETRCVVYRRTTGENYLWRLSGATLLSATALPSLPADWSFVSLRDFSGDGKADILWRNSSTGRVDLWILDGSTVASVQTVGTVADLAWTPCGTGDLDGNGRADIVWRRGSSGDLYYWLFNASGVTQVPGARVDTAMSMDAIADFNGDGTADLFWRNYSTGATTLWLMSGTTVISTAAGPAVTDTAWHVAASGDFSGDGRADLVWRRTSGEMYAWMMSGLGVLKTEPLPSEPDSQWEVVASR